MSEKLIEAMGYSLYLNKPYIFFKNISDDKEVDTTIDKLIRNKTPVCLEFKNYSLYKEFSNYGILLCYNDKFLCYVSNNLNICFKNLESILTIWIKDDIEGSIINLKIKNVFEKKRLFDNNKFLKNFPIEIKDNINSFLGYKKFNENYIKKYKLNCFELFTFIKENNFLVNISNDNYEEPYLSRIISVNENSIDLQILDENEIFITDLTNFEFKDINYMFGDFEKSQYLKYFEKNIYDDLISKTVKKIFPIFEFSNKFIQVEDDSFYRNVCLLTRVDDSIHDGDYYFVKKKDMEKLKFLSDNKDYLAPVKLNNFKNLYLFTNLLTDYSLLLKKNFSKEIFYKNFKLSKIETLLIGFSDFNEFLIIYQNNKYIFGKDFSRDEDGYFIINKTIVKDIKLTYVSDFRHVRLQNNFIEEVQKFIKYELDIFEVLKGKLCKLKYKDNNDFEFKIDNINNEDIIGTVLDDQFFPYEKEVSLKFKDVRIINFGSNYLQEISKNYKTILNIGTLLNYKKLYQNIINKFENVMKEYNLRNWYIRNVDKFKMEEIYLTILGESKYGELKKFYFDFFIDKNFEILEETISLEKID